MLSTTCFFWFEVIWQSSTLTENLWREIKIRVMGSRHSDHRDLELLTKVQLSKYRWKNTEAFHLCWKDYERYFYSLKDGFSLLLLLFNRHCLFHFILSDARLVCYDEQIFWLKENIFKSAGGHFGLICAGENWHQEFCITIICSALGLLSIVTRCFCFCHILTHFMMSNRVLFFGCFFYFVISWFVKCDTNQVWVKLKKEVKKKSGLKTELIIFSAVGLDCFTPP